MQTSRNSASNLNHAPSQHFATELSSQWQGGGNENGPVNTQFRHELPEQRKPQNLHPIPWQYPPSRFRSFTITTDSNSLSSGFPYSQRLAELRISPTQWMHFSNDIVNAAKLTAVEDKAAWTAGLATGAGATAFLLFFGPVVGYYAGKSVHKKTVIKKVKEKLASEGDLRSVFRQWNDGVFRERGIQATLHPPTESGEVVVDEWPGASAGDLERAAARMAKKFRIVLVPFDPRIHSSGPSFVQDSPVSPLSQTQESWSLVSTAPSRRRPSAQLQEEQQSDSEATPQLPPRKPIPVLAELPPAQSQPVAAELPSTQSYSVAYELDGGSVPR